MISSSFYFITGMSQTLEINDSMRNDRWVPSRKCKIFQWLGLRMTCFSHDSSLDLGFSYLLLSNYPKLSDTKHFILLSHSVAQTVDRV